MRTTRWRIAAIRRKRGATHSISGLYCRVLLPLTHFPGSEWSVGCKRVAHAPCHRLHPREYHLR